MKKYEETLSKVIADNMEMIEYYMDEYSKTGPGSDESRVITQNMKDCSASIIDAEKLRSELQNHEEAVIREEFLKGEQLTMELEAKRKMTMQQNILEGVKISTWVGITIFLAMMDFEFEKDNTKTFSWARKVLDFIMKKAPV